MNKKVGGGISFHKLEQWWFSDFTNEDRYRIINAYSETFEGDSLVEGKISSTSESSIYFLLRLSTCFKNIEDKYLFQKLLLKAESLVKNDNDVLGIHFFYQDFIEFNYRKRDNDISFYEDAKKYCLY